MKARRRPTLPPRLQGSTIGAEGLNYWVRNGTRCFPFAMATGNFEVVSALVQEDPERSRASASENQALGLLVPVA
jgi:hypothetical protein